MELQAGKSVVRATPYIKNPELQVGCCGITAQKGYSGSGVPRADGSRTDSFHRSFSVIQAQELVEFRTRRRPQDLVVFAMSIAVSPMATDAVSPMITTVTPTVEPRKAEEEEEEGRGGELAKEAGPAQRYDKPPPLHTGADWKVVLHLPEIETWLRCTADRVRDLTHSVHQDAHNKHVDVHLVQLKMNSTRGSSLRKETTWENQLLY